MKYKVCYHVGESLKFDTKLMLGKLSVNQQSIHISGPTPLEVDLSACQNIEIFRQPGLGNIIEISAPETRIFVTISHFNLAGIFLKIDPRKTVKLFHRIKNIRALYRQSNLEEAPFCNNFESELTR
jgi:hypothetical protein